MAGLSSTYWIHRGLQKVRFVMVKLRPSTRSDSRLQFLGNAGGILAGAESSSYRKHLDGYCGGLAAVFGRVLLTCSGIQMYWGGQAVRIILSSVIGPKFANMRNTIPPSSNVQTVDLVSFFIFVIILSK